MALHMILADDAPIQSRFEIHTMIQSLRVSVMPWVSQCGHQYLQLAVFLETVATGSVSGACADWFCGRACVHMRSHVLLVLVQVRLWGRCGGLDTSSISRAFPELCCPLESTCTKYNANFWQVGGQIGFANMHSRRTCCIRATQLHGRLLGLSAAASQVAKMHLSSVPPGAASRPAASCVASEC